jgi:hypothetical protein
LEVVGMRNEKSESRRISLRNVMPENDELVRCDVRVIHNQLMRVKRAEDVPACDV